MQASAIFQPFQFEAFDGEEEEEDADTVGSDVIVEASGDFPPNDDFYFEEEVRESAIFEYSSLRTFNFHPAFSAERLAGAASKKPRSGMLINVIYVVLWRLQSNFSQPSPPPPPSRPPPTNASLSQSDPEQQSNSLLTPPPPSQQSNTSTPASSPPPQLAGSQNTTAEVGADPSSKQKSILFCRLSELFR